ncbi:MAG TPA: sigma-70 family RNA polymerase sigma factor [Vicinamibacterales bacterium]|nr:sigma-70 family RNA polymerase sigma factor [Vicinamibacterales bacterium]
MVKPSSSIGDASRRPPAPSSRRLLARAQLGDPDALGELIERYLPQLHRWTHGRLARWVRAGADTTDIVHDAVLGAVRRLPAFAPRGPHALARYLRVAVRNRIRDEHRRFARRGVRVGGLESLVDRRPSPFDRAAAHQEQARYRAALARLSPQDRELIVAHVELDYTHEQLGCMTGRSPNAARMALQRAVHRLAERMRDG